MIAKMSLFVLLIATTLALVTTTRFPILKNSNCFLEVVTSVNDTSVLMSNYIESNSAENNTEKALKISHETIKKNIENVCTITKSKVISTCGIYKYYLYAVIGYFMFYLILLNK